MRPASPAPRPGHAEPEGEAGRLLRRGQNPGALPARQGGAPPLRGAGRRLALRPEEEQMTTTAALVRTSTRSLLDLESFCRGAGLHPDFVRRPGAPCLPQ